MIESLPVALNTTRIPSWDGPVDQLGPLYPFVGWEWLALVLAVIVVIFWFSTQWRSESAIYREDIQEYGDVLSMTKIVKGEHYSLSRTDIPLPKLDQDKE
jgi:hypothetical protein